MGLVFSKMIPVVTMGIVFLSIVAWVVVSLVSSAEARIVFMLPLCFYAF